MFYMGYPRYNAHDVVPEIEKNNIPILTNAIHRWSEAKENFLDMWEYDTPRIVDAGGYNVLDNYKSKYPWSVKDYHNWLKENNGLFRWATVMDYACEKSFDNVFSKEKRMEMTLENTIEHFDLNPNYKIIPVLQGRSLEDYLEFYDKLEDHGIPTNHVGLGTVCRISREKEIVKLEKKLRKKTDIKRLHGFGVKIDAYKKGVNFESADTQAWIYPVVNGNYYEWNKNGKIEVKRNENMTLSERWIKSIKEYHNYVTFIRNSKKFTCKQCGEIKTRKFKENINMCEGCGERVLKNGALKGLEL